MRTCPGRSASRPWTSAGWAEYDGSSTSEVTGTVIATTPSLQGQFLRRISGTGPVSAAPPRPTRRASTGWPSRTEHLTPVADSPTSCNAGFGQSDTRMAGVQVEWTQSAGIRPRRRRRGPITSRARQRSLVRQRSGDQRRHRDATGECQHGLDDARSLTVAKPPRYAHAIYLAVLFAAAFGSQFASARVAAAADAGKSEELIRQAIGLRRAGDDQGAYKLLLEAPARRARRVPPRSSGSASRR